MLRELLLGEARHSQSVFQVVMRLLVLLDGLDVVLDLLLLLGQDLVGLLGGVCRLPGGIAQAEEAEDRVSDAVDDGLEQRQDAAKRSHEHHSGERGDGGVQQALCGCSSRLCNSHGCLSDSHRSSCDGARAQLGRVRSHLSASLEFGGGHLASARDGLVLTGSVVHSGQLSGVQLVPGLLQGKVALGGLYSHLLSLDAKLLGACRILAESGTGLVQLGSLVGERICGVCSNSLGALGRLCGEIGLVLRDSESRCQLAKALLGALDSGLEVRLKVGREKLHLIGRLSGLAGDNLRHSAESRADFLQPLGDAVGDCEGGEGCTEHRRSDASGFAVDQKLQHHLQDGVDCLESNGSGSERHVRDCLGQTQHYRCANASRLSELTECIGIADKPILPALKILDVAVQGVAEPLTNPCDQLNESRVREALNHGSDGVDSGRKSQAHLGSMVELQRNSLGEVERDNQRPDDFDNLANRVAD